MAEVGLCSRMQFPPLLSILSAYYIFFSHPQPPPLFSSLSPLQLRTKKVWVKSFPPGLHFPIYKEGREDSFKDLCGSRPHPLAQGAGHRPEGQPAALPLTEKPGSWSRCCPSSCVFESPSRSPRKVPAFLRQNSWMSLPELKEAVPLFSEGPLSIVCPPPAAWPCCQGCDC